jgi:hypothetical protein
LVAAPKRKTIGNIAFFHRFLTLIRLDLLTTCSCRPVNSDLPPRKATAVFVTRSPGKVRRSRAAALLRGLGLAAALLACAFSMGLQWHVLQVAAWTRMAVAYRAHVGWRAAVIEAVAGPKCPLCIAIAAAEQESRKAHEPATANGDESRFVMSLPPLAEAMPQPAVRPLRFWADTAQPVLRREKPPIPPPRSAVG